MFFNIIQQFLDLLEKAEEDGVISGIDFVDIEERANINAIWQDQLLKSFEKHFFTGKCENFADVRFSSAGRFVTLPVLVIILLLVSRCAYVIGTL